jgi:hypothetical protein
MDLLSSPATRNISMISTPHTYTATTSTHFQPYIMEDFSFNFKQVHHNFVYITYIVMS